MLGTGSLGVHVLPIYWGPKLNFFLGAPRTARGLVLGCAWGGAKAPFGPWRPARPPAAPRPGGRFGAQKLSYFWLDVRRGSTDTVATVVAFSHVRGLLVTVVTPPGGESSPLNLGTFSSALRA